MLSSYGKDLVGKSGWQSGHGQEENMGDKTGEAEQERVVCLDRMEKRHTRSLAYGLAPLEIPLLEEFVDGGLYPARCQSHPSQNHSTAAFLG